MNVDGSDQSQFREVLQISHWISRTYGRAESFTSNLAFTGHLLLVLMFPHTILNSVLLSFHIRIIRYRPLYGMGLP